MVGENTKNKKIFSLEWKKIGKFQVLLNVLWKYWAHLDSWRWSPIEDHLISNLKFPLLRFVTYSQILGMRIWTALRGKYSYHNNYWSSKKIFSELIYQKLPLKFYAILFFSKILITTRLIKGFFFFFFLPLAEPGKSQVSFQSQRRAMPKNVQTTKKLSSFHMLVR